MLLVASKVRLEEGIGHQAKASFWISVHVHIQERVHFGKGSKIQV